MTRGACAPEPATSHNPNARQVRSKIAIKGASGSCALRALGVSGTEMLNKMG
jgi:hypothetical protein